MSCQLLEGLNKTLKKRRLQNSHVRVAGIGHSRENHRHARMLAGFTHECYAKVLAYQFGYTKPKDSLSQSYNIHMIPTESDDYADSLACLTARLDYIEIENITIWNWCRTQDKLGQCRDLGIGRAPRNHVLGIKSNILGEWGASDCIRGDFSTAEQMPDSNLGRSTRPGFRNINIKNRTFGCPTIRTDIAVPRT